MKANQKLLWYFMLFLSLVSTISCKKLDKSNSELPVNSADIQNQFFNSHRTGNPQEKKIISFLKSENLKSNFVIPTVALIGYPRWDKMVTKESPTTISERSPDSSSQTYFVPFVRDEDNYVNSAMVIKINNTDTTFFYKSDWEYTTFENNPEQLNDSAENFAAFFMTLDYVVFGHKNFKIIDSALFRNSNGAADRVKLDSMQLTVSNNLLVAVEYCSPTEISWNACPNPGQCRGIGGACDHCLAFCTKFLNVMYCWTGMVETGGSGGSGGSGGGGGEGVPNPPPCGGPVGARGNVPCTGGVGGWTPIEDDPPPYVAPATVTNIDLSAIDDSCLTAVLTSIGVIGHKSFILKTYHSQNFTNLGGTQQKFKATYTEDTSLVGNNGLPVPAQTAISILPDGTNNIQIALNPSMFHNSSREWVSAVILHELMHGILLVWRPDLTVSGNESQTSKNHHIFMFDHKVPLAIRQSLKELFPLLDDHEAIALGMDGLDEAYRDPSTGQINPIKDTFSITNYFQNILNAINIAQKYREAIFGVPFC